MTAPRLSQTDPSTLEYLEALRRLVKMYGPTETGRRLGRSKQNITNIIKGRRYARAGLVSPRSHITLEKLRLGTGKLCCKCGQPCWVLVDESNVCVECHVLELIGRGVVKVLPATNGDDDHERDD